MIFTNVRRRLRRYRTENPYSHTLLFLCLDVFWDLLKIFLVGLVLVTGWFFSSKWMSSLQQSPQAEAVILDESRQPVVPVVARSTEFTEIEKTDRVADAETDVATNDAKIPKQLSPEEEAAVVAKLFDNKWLLSQSRGNYTLQLGSSPEKEKLVAFAGELAIFEQAHIFAFKVSSIGNPIYGLSIGMYPDMESAQKSIEELPPSFRQFKPWVRPIGELQDQVVLVQERLAL